MLSRKQALDILREVHDACGKLYSIHDAYLYGSFARGDSGQDSDVDILLTVNASAEEISRQRRRLAAIASELSLAHDITVSIAVKPFEQFERFASVLPYYQNVMKEGVRYVQ